MRIAAPVILAVLALAACEDEETVTIETPAGTIEAEEDGDMKIEAKDPEENG